MSDLTRRVLEAHDRYTSPDLHAEQADIDGPLLINAAPILARQVEAVERRCAAMEAEGQPLAYAAALIRDALNTD